MDSLEWLNTPVSQRLRTIIFTPNAPVSKRWKVLVVSVYTCNLICTCSLTKSYTAHRVCPRSLRLYMDRMDYPAGSSACAQTATGVGRASHELTSLPSPSTSWRRLPGSSLLSSVSLSCSVVFSLTLGSLSHSILFPDPHTRYLASCTYHIRMSAPGFPVHFLDLLPVQPL